MATQSVRIGWRPYVNLTSVQAAANLLDSYSGAAAAYSLRKLRSSYSGSAIRVRRSSDNTELNIGFDSDGNLDTIALSSFVGSGNGFVTTWYDQTGNNFNRTQTTAAAQPNIVYLGAISMVNGKPAMYFDGTSTTFATQGPKIGETYQGAGYSSTVLNVTKLDSSYSTTAEYPLFGGTGWYDSRFSINSNKWYLINNGTGISSTVNASANQVVSSVVFAYTTDKVRINGTEVISGNVGTNGGTDYNYIGRSYLGKFYQGYFQEHIIYASDKTSVISAMETNMNTYYSAYPNPTSVWNLLNAVYSADTIASSSLKTSLVSVYNGESNTNDSKGTNNGTPQGGLTYTTGKIGNAFTFNGTNAYVSLPNNSLNSLTTDFSVSGWIYMPANTSSLYCVLLSNVSNDYTTGKGWSVFTYGNNIYFDVYYSGVYQVPNSAYVRLQANNTLTNNAWNHVTITRKNSTSSKIYINGSLVGSNTSIQNPATPTAAITPTIGVLSSVGVGNPLSSYAPNGTKIDALNIWTKELTASEVSELYNSGNGAQYITDSFYKPTTNDALGTNNGTAQGGLTYGTGKIGNAFNFNGSNSAINLSTNSMNLTGDFSISTWVNLSNNYTGVNEVTLLMNLNVTSWFTNPKGIHLNINNNNLNFNLFADTNTNSLFWNDSTGSIIKANSGWIHVVATRKSATGSKLYVNGVLKASNTNTIDSTYHTSFQVPTIGRRFVYDRTGNLVNNSMYAPDGTKIDALNIWQKELTQSEITELYNSGNGKQYPN